MRRLISALIATAFLSLTIGTALADDVNLKTNEGIKKFWDSKVHESGDGGGNGGGNGGGGQ